MRHFLAGKSETLSGSCAAFSASFCLYMAGEKTSGVMGSEHCAGLRVSLWRTGYIMARNFPPVWITVTYMTRVPLFSFGASWNGSLPLWVAPWKLEELRCPLLLPSLWRVWQLSVLVRVSAQLRWTALDSQHELATQQTVCRPVKKGWKLKTQLSSWTIKDRF